MVTCPECDIEIKIDETDLEEMEVGDPWVCDGCASNLRLASIDPLEFEADDEEDDEEEEEAEEKADAAEGDDDVADDEDDDADGDDWDE